MFFHYMPSDARHQTVDYLFAVGVEIRARQPLIFSGVALFFQFPTRLLHSIRSLSIKTVFLSCFYNRDWLTAYTGHNKLCDS